jgi:hypothetical protein
LSPESGRRLRAGPRQLGPGQSGRRPALAAERQGRGAAAADPAQGLDAGCRRRCRSDSAAVTGWPDGPDRPVAGWWAASEPNGTSR